MYLEYLLLQNFRSYEQKLIKLGPKVNLILGPNGSGKTNLLESIYFLSTGKSFRASSLSKLIRWNAPFTTVRGKIHYNSQDEEIEARLINNTSSQSRTVSRQFLIQKVQKTRKKYLGTLQSVVFHPDDIRMVTGSPSRRREFLDSIFSSYQWRYSQSLSQYNKALKHRNELLDQISTGRSSKSELFYWDQSLLKNDQIIHDYRHRFINYANSFFSKHSHPEIRALSLNYHPVPTTLSSIENNYQTDLKRGHTQSGCHRDDFSFDSSLFPSSDKDLASWGSRGQQRLAVLALRLAQINFLQSVFGKKPVLLLDDIFSELDTDHRNLVSQICQDYQAVFTSSESNSLDFLPQAVTIDLGLPS